jgi:hypothetical protein
VVAPNQGCETVRYELERRGKIELHWKIKLEV